jgi:hypothetical protein
VKFDTGQEKEDRLQEAQAMQTYIDAGVVSVDEVRAKIFGFKVDPDAMVPRFVMSTRLGPIPLSYLISVGGEINTQTGAPEPRTIVPTQFVLPGTQAPDPLATPEEQRLAAIAMHSANDPAHALALPPELKVTPAEEQAAVAGSEAVGASEGPTSKGPSPSEASGSKPVQKSVDVDETRKVLRKWRDSARDQVRKGRKPRLFSDPQLPDEVVEFVWESLQHARSREQVDAAFHWEP